MSATPWQIADVPGPKHSLPIKPAVCARLVKTSKRPLLVVGGLGAKGVVGGSDIASRMVELARLLKAPIVVSPGVYKSFAAADGVRTFCVGLEDLVNRLKEKDWIGLDSKGGYDMVLFAGGIYYFQSLMLSTLKNFAPDLKTIAIDRFFHPNATFSFENMSEEEWLKGLDVMIGGLRR